MDAFFNGKRVLVTGASQGIGRDIALKLAECGAKVIAFGRNKDLLEKLKGESPAIKFAVSVDLCNWQDTKRALETIGSVDLLVNNAGVAQLGPLEDITEAHIDESFAVNVKAMINITQYVVNDMKVRKVPGSIVNVSSQASMAGLKEHAVYCATKGAMDAFTRAVALELGGSGIRVNCVNPTVIMTEMGKIGWSDPAKAKPMLEKIPLNKFGEVEDVTNAVLFLLSDKSRMITGHCLPVDGGFLAC